MGMVEGKVREVSYNLERAVLLSEHLAPDFGGGIELHQDVGDVAPRIKVAVARNCHRSVVPGLHSAGLAPTVCLGVVELRGGHQFVHLAPPLAALLPCVDGAVDPRHHHLSANVKSPCQKGILAKRNPPYSTVPNTVVLEDQGRRTDVSTDLETKLVKGRLRLGACQG
jgi:hypothetical protein